MNFFGTVYCEDQLEQSTPDQLKAFAANKFCKLLNYLGIHYSTGFEQAFQKNARYQYVPEGEVVIDFGEIHGSSYFIVDGYIKVEKLHPSGNVQDMLILDAGNIFVSIESFFFDKPSDLKFVAATACHIMMISGEKHEKLYNREFGFSFEEMSMSMMKYFLRYQKDLVQLFAMTNNMKMETFFQVHPSVLLNAPLDLLAGILQVPNEELLTFRNQKYQVLNATH